MALAFLAFEDGKEAVYCHRSDGLAISKIKNLGVSQVIISTEKNAVVQVRAQKLGIEVIQGVEDKKSCLTEYCKKNDHSLQNVVYIGNDSLDQRLDLNNGTIQPVLVAAGGWIVLKTLVTWRRIQNPSPDVATLSNIGLAGALLSVSLGVLTGFLTVLLPFGN